jgi:2-polyprenyl-3-methyl-5-hydroxy-6-metoxy-1,4-benzoquinol methylase
MEAAEAVKSFHEKHGVVPDEDGWYSAPRNKGSLPVTDEQFLENISVNMSRSLEVLRPSRYDPRTFVMCAGGPSLADHLEEVRAKSLDPNYLVVASNMTGGYLLSNGIVPNAHFIIDAQPKKADDIAPGNTHPDTEYWIALNCDISVTDSLLAQGRTVKHFFCASNIGGERLDEVKVKECMKEHGIQQIICIGGGTMAGLRSINLAEALGFRKFEFYGFDGSIRGPEKCYAYAKTRKEMMVEVKTPDGRSFQSTTILADQATQFLEWENRLAWIDFTIHGDGFIRAMQECQRSIDAEEDPQIEERITPAYLELQKQLHAKGNYGITGKRSADSIFMMAVKLLKKQPSVTILDYGCGTGGLKRAIDDNYAAVAGSIIVKEYDPCINEKMDEPEPADIVVCTDVLEHVEKECTQATLRHIAQLTKKVAFFSVCTVPAIKTLPDGRNAHINVRSQEWWFKNIKRFYKISDYKSGQNGLVVIGETI